MGLGCESGDRVECEGSPSGQQAPLATDKLPAEQVVSGAPAGEGQKPLRQGAGPQVAPLASVLGQALMSHWMPVDWSSGMDPAAMLHSPAFGQGRAETCVLLGTQRVAVFLCSQVPHSPLVL